MHLLSVGPHGIVTLTEFVGSQTPPYAILSHTWGPDLDEVSFKYIRKSRGEHKPGYKKIKFCLEQASQDGLEYCWVDTCCIDKANNTQLQEAINSMFKWYKRANKCYVYLSDVPAGRFRDSRWFTRGWTLQELLAPAHVSFYSCDRTFLGDKQSLIQEIHDITDIPLDALQGYSLSRFSIEEKMSWISHRQTKREEDMAYSLLGIFDILMPLLYGEGRDRATSRLLMQLKESYFHFSVPFDLPYALFPSPFVGRIKELIEIERALPHDGRQNLVVLHGLGGVGKTQLAIQYSKTRQSEYSAIFWMDGTDENSLQRSFVDAAKRLTGVNSSLTTLKHAAEAEDTSGTISDFTTWLSSPGNNRWLIVIDNYDDPYVPNEMYGLYDVRPYFPASAQGHLLIISRSSQLRIGKQIEVQCIRDWEECLSILQVASQRPSIVEEPGTHELLDRLQGLPLALSVAGTCLNQSPVTTAEYLEQYQRSWLDLQRMTPSLAEHQGRSLRTTWEPSLIQIQKRSIDARNLLQLLAFLGRQDIWYELLAAGRDGAPEWFTSVTDSKFSLTHYMRILCNHGLVRTRGVSAGYEMHSCVHDWLRATHGQDEDMSDLALRCVSKSVPSNQEPEYWVSQRRLLDHANQWDRWIRITSWTEEFANNMDNLGRLYFDQGRLADAEAIHRSILDNKKKLLGESHLSTIETRGCIGAVCRERGKFVEAEENLQLVLKIQEKELGSEDIATLDTIHEVGLLYIDQNKLADAEAMLLRAQRGYQAVGGSSHISSSQIAGKLGFVCQCRKKFDEADKMYTQALFALEEKLGPDHPSTLDVVTNIGELRHHQGNFLAGERMLIRARSGLEKAFGPDHKATLCTMQLLGNLYKDRRDYGDAEPLLEEVTEGYQKLLDPNHRWMLDAMECLGFVYHMQDKHDKAVKMHLRALAGYEKTLGSEHADTTRAMCNIALAYEKQGKYSAAEAMYLRTLAGLENILEPDDTQMLDVMFSLALSCAEQGKHVEAANMYAQVLAGREKTLGVDNLKTQAAMYNLAWNYAQHERYTDAEKMYERVLECYENLLGENDVRTLDTIKNFAWALADHGRYADAVTMFLRALAGYEKLEGPEHTITLEIVSGLGTMYLELEKYTEADAMYSRALAGCTKTLGQKHSSTQRMLRNLQNLRSTYITGTRPMIEGSTTPESGV